ncbi:MAG: sensor domain-containing diguanylate cyclase [Oceanospirillaceae bacterium]|nr:sensor domain-containing diguanylate cyclase [Oceanospirillaceae bacterium]
MINHQSDFSKRRLLPYLAIAFVVLVGIFITEYVQKMVADRTYQLQRTEAMGVISQLRARLESEVNSVLFLSSGLISYVTVQPYSTPEQWRPLAAEIVRSSAHVRNIGLAPDNVIRFVYPIHGNENAIGLDYEANVQQWPAVKRAIDKGELVLAGPVQLVQGGLGLIARTPIYARSEPTAPSRYWGLASVVIDAESLFASAGLAPIVEVYRISIVGKDGRGLNGEMVFGDQETLDKSIVTLTVDFPGGQWVMGAKPDSSSTPFWMGKHLVRLVAYSFLLVLVTLLVILVRLYHSSHGEAMHDALTGLPNRRLMIERISQLTGLNQRTGIKFALYFIDLNDFKPVNDHYGHAAGDTVLREVGRRLQKLVRASDTVARTGGDEFMVLQPAVNTESAAQAVADKIEQVLAMATEYQGNSVSISASVGFAIFPDDADSLDRLIMLADDRMYARKAEIKGTA